MPNKLHILLSQSKLWMFSRRVRDAFVRSVKWFPPRTPPLKFQRIQLSKLPKQHSFLSMHVCTAGSLSISHLILTAEKQTFKGSPQTDRNLSAFVLSFAKIFSTVPCKNCLLDESKFRGSPVFLFHKIVLSLWFVIPTAMMSSGWISRIIKLSVATLMHSLTQFQISMGSNSWFSDEAVPSTLLIFSSWHVRTSAFFVANIWNKTNGLFIENLAIPKLCRYEKNRSIYWFVMQASEFLFIGLPGIYSRSFRHSALQSDFQIDCQASSIRPNGFY